MEAIMQSTGDAEEIKQEQDENTKIYKKFMSAKDSNDLSAEGIISESFESYRVFGK